MAKNTNKRISVKWIRDKAKSAYVKDTKCFVCGTTVDLELHHTHSITLLLEQWVKKTGYDISTDDGILAVRDEFIADHQKEIYDEVYTLCNPHHVKLHSVFGKAPSLTSAPRQSQWLIQQRDNPSGPSIVVTMGAKYASFYGDLPSGPRFAPFYKEVEYELVQST